MFPLKVVACVTTYWSKKSMSNRHETQCKCSHNFPSSFSWTELKLYVFGYLCFCSKEFRVEKIVCTTPKRPHTQSSDNKYGWYKGFQAYTSLYHGKKLWIWHVGYWQQDTNCNSQLGEHDKQFAALTNRICFEKHTFTLVQNWLNICCMIFNTSLLIEPKIWHGRCTRRILIFGNYNFISIFKSHHTPKLWLQAIVGYDDLPNNE